MAESVTVYEFGDEFLLLARMDQAIAELKKLNELMDQQQKRSAYRPPMVVTRRVVHERLVKRPEPALVFPFSLFAFLIARALSACDRLAARFVTRTIPYLVGHLNRFLHPKKPSEVVF
jgi:hypothetical protein